MSFKTFGSAMESFVQHARSKLQVFDEKNRHKLDPYAYTRERVTLVHDSFVEWGLTVAGIEESELPNCRLAMVMHATRYRNMGRSETLRMLSLMPTKYNVRGVWTPL